MIKKTMPLILLTLAMLTVFVNPAFADLEGDLEILKDRVLAIAIPIGAVILIFAGIMMAQGRPDAVKSALIGLLFIFAASGIVLFISSIFG